MSARKHVRFGLLGIFVSGIALLFILRDIEGSLFVDAWRSARYIYLLPTVALLVAGLLTRARRWQILLDDALPYWRAFSIMNVAYLVNGVLPLRIGEVARIYLATRVRKPVPMMQTASTIIVERLLDLLGVVMMVFIALSLGPVPQQIQTASMVAAVAAISGFTVLVALGRYRALTQRLYRGVMGRLPILRNIEVLESLIEQFLDGLQPLTRPRTFFAAILWTALSWGLSTAAGYVLMFAFFDDASMVATLLYIAAAAFAIALPAVPGNVGTYEASILLAIYAVGYPQGSTAVAFAVMVHAVNVIVHASTGAVGLIHEGISLSQLTHGVQNIQQTSQTRKAG